jgi:hypothetical protein
MALMILTMADIVTIKKSAQLGIVNDLFADQVDGGCGDDIHFFSPAIERAWLKTFITSSSA